ncbi:MAG TPA: PH domain-containing protein [Pedococcus sp.]|nr:PH domain-containing protein [Pedococcus sp.]
MTESPARDSSAGDSVTTGWQHLHPLSPFLRGGVAFVGAVGYVFSQQVNRIFGSAGDDPTQGHPLYAAVGAVLLLGVILGGAWVSWRVSKFRIGTAFLELRHGLLFRQHRQVPFDRIQAVDISRPVLARLTGLSEVVVQSAGGRDSHIKLAFLPDSRAQEVRELLLALAERPDETGTLRRPTAIDDAAETVGEAADPVAETAHIALRVPNARLIQATLYSGGAVFLAVAIPTLLVGFATGNAGAVGWLGPMVLGVGGRHVRHVVRDANFTVRQQGDRLMVRRGLVDLRSTSVPLHRIQAVGLVQPMFWRPLGWWRLHVNVAGAGSRADEDTETQLLPVGTMAEALGMLALIRPRPTDWLADSLGVAALTGQGHQEGFTTASRRARVLDPWSWRRKGYAVTPDCVLVRRGALRREAQVVPHARIQALGLRQGPLQRWRGVATVTIASTRGPVRVTLAHLGLLDAESFLHDQTGRSSRARA